MQRWFARHARFYMHFTPNGPTVLEYGFNFVELLIPCNFG